MPQHLNITHSLNDCGRLCSNLRLDTLLCLAPARPALCIAMQKVKASLSDRPSCGERSRRQPRAACDQAAQAVGSMRAPAA